MEFHRRAPLLLLQFRTLQRTFLVEELVVQAIRLGFEGKLGIAYYEVRGHRTICGCMQCTIVSGCQCKEKCCNDETNPWQHTERSNQQETRATGIKL